MARMPRVTCPGLPHHIIQRGNNRSAIFFDDSDYHAYLNWLGEAMQKYGCKLHAYVLMTNHIHLLLTPETDLSIGQVMQSLGRCYVRYINGVYQRTGTLWEGRFKSSVVQSESYLLTCYRYIELNPVRAGMVNSPEAYRWSSYASNALGYKDKYIEVHEEYLRLGGDEHERCRAYRGLFVDPIETDLLQEIRSSTNRNEVLGNDRFKDEIQSQLGRRVRLHPHGGDRRSKRFVGES
ncbi:MAG: transposase [Candidatus Thiodiazotropha sp. (ex Myrtea sp. 'scaly one' KF741663)]|nr:transposase [Candidatus Thiodiazotropha sp. (ex Myrtea sp. 'scaly one' KF741663)]